MTVLTDLDLSDNPLQYISTQIFDGLSNLTTLFIRKSFLYKQRDLVLDSLFSDLKSLQRLAFTFLYVHPWPLYLLPDCSKVHKSQSFGKVDSLQNVKTLKIDSVLLKWKRNDTLKSTSFQCEKLYLVNGEFCFYSHLTQEQFEYMPYLGTLTITHPFCQSKIADDFVQGLKYLKELSVQGPHHGIVYVETFMLVHNVTKAIVNVDKISKLTLINIGDKIKMKFLRCDSDFYNMTGLFELEEIDISNNYFKFEPVDCNQFPVSLNTLIIRDNCISESMLTEIVLKVNAKLITVDASDQNRCGEEMANDKAVSLPKEAEKTINMYNLKKFIFTKSIHKLDFGSEKDSYPLLKYLDISFNNFTSPHEEPSDVIPNFFSASRPKLEYLNVSNCGIKDLQHYSLSNFSKLKYLDLSSNKLGKMKCELSDELSILTSLKEMNLANNNVDCIQPYLFIMMTYIEMINISDNNLKTFDASLTVLRILITYICLIIKYKCSKKTLYKV